MTRHARYLGLNKTLGRAAPAESHEYVPRTEAEEARRKARAFLRERDEDNVAEWDEPGSESYTYTQSWNVSE